MHNFLVTPQVLAFQKIIVGKIFLRGWMEEGGPSIMSNLRKIDLNLFILFFFLCYMNPFNFFFTKFHYYSFVIHQKQNQKNIYVFVGMLDTYIKVFKSWFYGHFGPQRGNNQIFFQNFLLLLYHLSIDTNGLWEYYF